MAPPWLKRMAPPTISVTRDTRFASRGATMYLFDQGIVDESANAVLGVWTYAFYPRFTSITNDVLPADALGVAYLLQLSGNGTTPAIVWNQLPATTPVAWQREFHRPLSQNEKLDGIPPWLEAGGGPVCGFEYDSGGMRSSPGGWRHGFLVDNAGLLAALSDKPTVSVSYPIAETTRSSIGTCQVSNQRKGRLSFHKGALIGSISHGGTLSWSRPSGQARISVLVISGNISQVFTLSLETRPSESHHLTLEMAPGVTLTENGDTLKRHLGTL